MDNFFTITDEELKSYSKGPVRANGYYNLIIGIGFVFFYLYLNSRLLQGFTIDYNLLSFDSWKTIYTQLSDDPSFNFDAHVPSLIGIGMSSFFLIKYGYNKFIETHKLPKYLAGVSGEIIAVDQSNSNKGDQFIIKIDQSYIYDEDRQTFTRDRELMGGQNTVKLNVPLDEHDMVGIYKRVSCIYGRRSKMAYKIEFDQKEINRKYEMSTYTKLDNPIEHISDKIEDDDDTIFGEIIYAKAVGYLDDNDVSWEFTILAKEFHSMKAGRDFDRSKSNILGQTLEFVDEKYDYYLYKRALEFTGFRDDVNRFFVGDSVTIKTNKRYNKLLSIKHYEQA
jgi:hypothetical protein